MAATLHNGIIPGAEAKKLYSYPTLSASSDTLLLGSGSWAQSADVTVGTSLETVKLQNSVNIGGFVFDGTQSMGRYFRCTTNGSDQIKKLSEVTGFDPHAVGAWFVLWLANNNTAVSPQIQFGEETPQPIVSPGDTSFDDDVSCRRLIAGAYLVVHPRGSDQWMIIAGPAGYYRTADSTGNGMMSKADKMALDTVVAALNNPCTVSFDSNGNLIAKLYGSSSTFLKIDKAGEW